MTTDKPTQLRIPDELPDHTLGAAMAYAECGWYGIPIDQATKHAGSVLDRGWPAKSSQDREQIVEWFAGTDSDLALHVGRSGAVAFDVDAPDKLPPELVSQLALDHVPFQSTRAENRWRGHYLFATPTGRMFGNSNGNLGEDWGEVRGPNGIIVVEPTVHQKAGKGGHYRWVRTGALPILPSARSDRLRPPATSVDVTIPDADITRLASAARPYRGPVRFSAPPGELQRRSHPLPIQRSSTKDAPLSTDPSLEVWVSDIGYAAMSLFPHRRDEIAQLLRPAPRATESAKRRAS